MLDSPPDRLPLRADLVGMHFAEAMAEIAFAYPPCLMVTMSIGQKWDNLLAGAYEVGGMILEVDEDEKVVRAFQKRNGRQAHRNLGVNPPKK